MKITNRIEQIFAHAVALDQSGRMKNTIHVLDNEIYIVNYDYTILMRFRLRKSEAPFDNPISFNANDYDSAEFTEDGGRIIFKQENDGYERKKICGTPDSTPEQVKKLFKSYIKELPEAESVFVDNAVLPLLDENLSHLEFKGEAGSNLQLIQRNIYSGELIEIEKKGKGMFDGTLENDLPICAIRTKDFLALYAFQDVLSFSFPLDDSGWLYIKSSDRKKQDMSVIVAKCVYDEIIKIKEADNGRQKQKKRRSK